MVDALLLTCQLRHPLACPPPCLPACPYQPNTGGCSVTQQASWTACSTAMTRRKTWNSWEGTTAGAAAQAAPSACSGLCLPGAAQPSLLPPQQLLAAMAERLIPQRLEQRMGRQQQGSRRSGCRCCRRWRVEPSLLLRAIAVLLLRSAAAAAARSTRASAQQRAWRISLRLVTAAGTGALAAAQPHQLHWELGPYWDLQGCQVLLLLLLRGTGERRAPAVVGLAGRQHTPAEPLCHRLLQQHTCRSYRQQQQQRQQR